MTAKPRQLAKKPHSRGFVPRTRTRSELHTPAPQKSDSIPVIKENVLTYHGANYFRTRVVLATVFRRPIVIDNIRSDDSNPGIQKYEASLLRLIDTVTDGGDFNIDVTGTRLRYTPGMIQGGESLTHDCGSQRNISYFLEALLLLAPFGKQHLTIKLKGITHGTGLEGVTDSSVDHFRTVPVPLMTRFGIESGVVVKVIKKGIAPFGSGEVEFSCSTVKKIPPFQLVEEGRVKRVRGTAFVSNLSPQFSVRLVDKCRAVLNDYLPDVWVYTSTCRKGVDGKSAGYGVTLVAETMKGFFKAADVVVDDGTRPKLVQFMKKASATVDPFADAFHRATDISTLLHNEEKKGSVPITKPLSNDDEDRSNVSEMMECEVAGRLAAQRLLLEAHYGGIVDTSFQHIPLLFMAVAEETQMCKIKLGQLSPYCIQYLRHLRDFSNVTFAFEKVKGTDIDESSNSEDSTTDEESGHALRVLPQFIVKCVGIGFRNIGRKTF